MQMIYWPAARSLLNEFDTSVKVIDPRSDATPDSTLKMLRNRLIGVGKVERLTEKLTV